MSGKIDSYLEEVIGRGDEGSALLNKLTVPTLKNCSYVDVISQGMNGVAVLKNLPEDHVVVVYSIGGDPKIKDLANYTASAVDRLARIAKINNLKLLAFADVVDASKGDRSDVQLIGDTLRNVSDKYGLSVMNGELAIMGPMVNCIANINCTAIAIGKKNGSSYNSPFMLGGMLDGVRAAAFDHDGKPVYINSDGEGTKSEFEVRTGTYENGLLNSAAMKLDDLVKIGARAKVVSDIVQTKGNIPIERMQAFAQVLSERFGVQYITQQEIAEDRIRGHSIDSEAFNISGSSVSLVDEERLKNPLKPYHGNYLVAISGRPNPRSNGITDKRKLMVELLGENYHETKIGKIFLEYLAEPSIVFYPHIEKLIDDNSITSFYHMSGGAYEKKLAKNLAKHSLFVRLENLFTPDWRELALCDIQKASAATAYAKWPMGNDGFVTTERPEIVINYFEKQNLKARVVGQLEKNLLLNRTGVELTAYNGEKVTYSGK